MKNDDLNMDKIFREKLEGYSVEPSAHLWNGIQGQMAALRRKKRIAYISRFAAAAVVLLAFLAGWYFNEKTEDIMPETTQNKIIDEENIQTEVPGISSKKDVQLNNNNVSPSVFAKPVEKIEEHSTRESLIAENQAPDRTGDKEALSGLQERMRLERLDNLDANLKNNKDATLALRKVTTKTKSDISNTERVLIAGNIQSKADNKEKEKGWKMGVNIAPGYSSHTSGYTNNYAQNMTYAGSEGEENVSGGISVQYKTRSRWSVESGVYYAQNTQASFNTPQLFAYSGENSFDQIASPAAGERFYFNTALKVEDNQAIMNSAAGVIAFSDLPKGAEIAANPEITDSYANALLTSGEFSQVFDFVEIPLYLRYLILDSNFDIELIGGVNAGLVVGNNAFIKNDDGVQNIGKTKDVSSLNMSGTFGVGVNYALGKHISLSMEPRLSYYLNSINSNPEVNYRPYRIGIYTGLFYEF